MEVEEYFADALAFGEAIWKLRMVADEKKPDMIDNIAHLPYIKNIRTFQKLPSAKCGSDWVSTMRGDYFLNPAVPCKAKAEREVQTYASGYHTHDYYELVVVLRGSYKQCVNGSRFEHGKGQVCLLPPGTLHREELQGWEDRVLFIGVRTDFFESELCPRINKALLEMLYSKKKSQYSHQFFVFSLSDNKKVQTLLLKIMEEDMLKESGHHMVIKGYLVRLIEELSGYTEWNCFKQSRAETEERLTKEILCYMEQHLTTVTKNELGAYFHFNPDYLGRFLLKKTGNTYSENLNSMRMERAVKLLYEGESVNSVIQKLGFSNKGHFNKILKKYYGMLPGEYRNQKLR